jgi:predicted RNase H-like HicB family nuclease
MERRKAYYHKYKYLILNKYIKSFFKSDWEIQDYPMLIGKIPFESKNFKSYSIEILKWRVMSARGDTLEEAARNLYEKFLEFKKENPLPRPGTLVPFEVIFAKNEIMGKYEELAFEFFEKIYQRKYLKDIICTDESSIKELDDGDEFKFFNVKEKIEKIYGIDIGQEHFISKILEKIADKKYYRKR